MNRAADEKVAKSTVKNRKILFLTVTHEILYGYNLILLSFYPYMSGIGQDKALWNVF